MRKTRKRVITFESRWQTIVYRGGVRFEISCGLCGSRSVTILPEGTGEEDLDHFKSRISDGTCVDNTCRQLLEAETLPKVN